MRNVILGLLVTLLCIGAVASTYFTLDRRSPDIRANGTPSLACNTSFDDLLNYASASDDKEIKSFFIEEKSLDTIAENGYLTYVAVDTSNHVRKLQTSVTVDSLLKQHHIEILKPLQFQVKEAPVVSEYVVVKNGCGWTLDEHIEIENVDFTRIGKYDALIYSRKHSDIEIMEEEAVVDDFRVPKILLNESYAEGLSSRHYDDDYFMGFVDHVEDDHDNVQTLYEKITCDWRKILSASDSGYVSKPGTYTITYRVIDSEGFEGMSQLTLRLNAPAAVSETAEGE